MENITNNDKDIRVLAEEYLNGFNSFPYTMIETLMEKDYLSWEEVTIFDDDDEPYSFLPMANYLWQFSNELDNYWLEQEDGIEVMSKLGFRIYEHNEWGYFFGIDSAGHDYYTAYWIPLYIERFM